MKPDSFESRRAARLALPSRRRRARQGSRPPEGRQGLTFFTALMELKGFEERRGPSRETGTEHGAIQNRVTWTDRRIAPMRWNSGHRPPALRAGDRRRGSGTGIERSARRGLGVPTLIVDRNPRPGDARRNRYKSLPARSGLVRPSAVPAVPRSLADLHAQGQDGRLARGRTPRSWNSTTGRRPRARVRVRRRRARWTVVVERDGKR